MSPKITPPYELSLISTDDSITINNNYYFLMGKKGETKTAGTISYSTSRAASRAYGELDDFMD
jgi:hypothetical protein